MYHNSFDVWTIEHEHEFEDSMSKCATYCAFFASYMYFLGQ